MRGSNEQGEDFWRAIEEAAIEAFQTSANPAAPGLMTALRRSAHYGKVDRKAGEIVIDQRAFLLGVISSGVLVTPSASYGNTASWAADWIRNAAGDEVISTIINLATPTDAIIEGYRSGLRVVASRSMVQIAQLAAELAIDTVGRSQADLRHFVVAALKSSNAPQIITDFGWQANAEDLRQLLQELLDRIRLNPEASEKMEAWRHILLVGDQMPPGASRSQTYVAGFVSDRVGTPVQGSDPLELLPEVSAFARLICLRDVEPPLSIGVFGGWGSGKSTFMQLLESEVFELTKRARATRDDDAKGPAFVRNIVQIRFNAWHFADANLWASLTAEFFDQLRAGGYKQTGKAIHTRLVERVNEHVHRLSLEVATTHQALASSERELLSAQKERDRAFKETERAPGETLKQSLLDAVTGAYEKHKSDLVKLGQQRGVTPEKDVEAFLELTQRLQTFSGQFQAVCSFAISNGWRVTLVIAGALAVAASTLWLNASGLGGIPLQVLTLLGGIGAISRAILPGMRVVGNLVQSTSSFASKLQGDVKQRLATLVQAEEALNQAAAENEAQRVATNRATRALSRYIDPSSKVNNPPRLLRFMLEDDPDTKALEKEIGLISRARRLFQAVDEIVKQERSDPRQVDVPDRIVVYIDDLDRCTPAQVYSVLQAVHLLLAFDLFIVVVGVDVTWVQEALVRELRPDLRAFYPNSGIPQRGNPAEERRLATRYLERIFQLPFWLRHLSSTGAGGGSYGRFVRELLAADLEPLANSPEIRAGEAPQATEPAQPSTVRRNSGAGTDQTNRPQSSLQSNLREDVATVKLKVDEINFLACEAIGALGAREPRSVKRLVGLFEPASRPTNATHFSARRANRQTIRLWLCSLPLNPDSLKR